MSWASKYIESLQNGKEVKFRPHGNSMIGKIDSGDLCTLIPITVPPQIGDIVLCKVNGNQYLHLIKAIQGERYQICNNRGRINGWTNINQIYGKCIKVEK